MPTLYDASQLVFTGTNFGGFVQTVHTTGTVSWDAATSTGSWNISMPFLTFNDLVSVDLGVWVSGGVGPSTIEFTASGYQVTSSANNDTVQGDVNFSFAPALSGNAPSALSGTINVQNDFAPYAIVGTVSGNLVPIASMVPEPAAAVLLTLGLLAGALMSRRRAR